MKHKVVKPNKKYQYHVGALCWWLTLSIIGILVVGAAILLILKRLHHHDSAQSSAVPTNIVQKYASALELALQFFDVQKCNQNRYDMSSSPF